MYHLTGTNYTKTGQELQRLHEIFGLEYRHWWRSSSSPDCDWGSDSGSESASDEGDSDDLDPPPTKPSDLEHAISLYQPEAVRALFGHIGLSYTTFSDFFERNDQRMKKVVDPAERKRRGGQPARKASKRRINPAGELRGESYWGSPTEAATESTKSHDSNNAST